jgi:DNA-binding response OmpR family regulator
MQQGHILLVEDNPHMRRILSLVLEQAGHTVTQADDGQMAIDMLMKQTMDAPDKSSPTYEVVLSDILMDNRDGIEVMHVARSLDVPPEVILLTGHGTLETAMDAIRSGAFDYLLKPCENDHLLERIAAALDHYHQKIRQAHESKMLHTMTTFLKENQEVIEGKLSPPPPPTAPHLQPPSPVSTEQPQTSAEQQHRYQWVGKLCIDSYRREVWFNQRQVSMTPNEYSILACLSSMEGQFVSFSSIIQYTRGYTMTESEAKVLLRQHILNLRKKIDRRYIVSIYGVGYMLVDPDAPPAAP